MERTIIAGYVIIGRFAVRDGLEIIMGFNEKAPASYATWECRNGVDYYWGHYCETRKGAVTDFAKRVLTYENIELF